MGWSDLHGVLDIRIIPVQIFPEDVEYQKLRRPIKLMFKDKQHQIILQIDSFYLFPITNIILFHHVHGR